MPIYLLIITTFGLLARVYSLGKFGLSFDEAVCVHISSYFKYIFSPGTKLFASDGTFFIILLKGWTAFGQSDSFLRFLSVLCGMLSILMVYYLGEFIFSKKAGILSALLLSLSPLHIHYSQELTYYSLTLLLGLASTYYFLKFLRKTNLKASILYVIATLGFIYNHPINPILLLIQNMFFYLFYYKDKPLKRKWLFYQAVIIILAIPWLITVSSQFLRFTKVNIFYWIPKPNVGSLLQTFLVFSLGYHVSSALQLVAFIILLFFLGKGIFYWREKKEVFYLIFWLIIPVSIIWLISQRYPFYLHRLFFFSLPAFILLIAAGIAKSKRCLGACLLVFYFILVLFTLRNYYGNKLPVNYQKKYVAVWPKKDYRQAALYVTKKFRDGDVVLHICRSSFFPFLYYLGEGVPEYGVNLNGICKEDWIKIWDNKELPRPEGYFKNGMILSIKNKDDLRNYKRVWLIYSSWDWLGLTRLPYNDEPGKIIVDWFISNLSKVSFQMFDGLNIYLFSMNAENRY